MQARPTQNMGGIPAHASGTAAVTAATVTLAAVSTSIMITNRSTSINLLVSFDAGTSWATIPALTTGDAAISLECNVSSLQVKSASSTADYEILYTKVGDPA